MKKCTRCNEAKELNQYCRNKSQSSGYNPHCKQCHKLAYPDRLWNKTDKGRRSAKVATKAWSERNRKKVNAHSNLNYHLKKGNVTKALSCQSCGSHSPLDAHHKDYSQPLSVEWLCRSCHKSIHSH